MSAKFKHRVLGALPTELINSTIGTELEPGPVFLSAIAHRHMAHRHPEDYKVCYEALETALSAPTYIGQDTRHRDNFFIIKRVLVEAQHSNVLVSIGLERDDKGSYRIKSSYIIKPADVERRRQKRTLFVAIMPK